MSVSSVACRLWHSAYILSCIRGNGYNGLHFGVKVILAYNFIGHGYPEWFHGVIDRIVIGSDHIIEVVENIFLPLKHTSNYYKHHTHAFII